MTGQAMNPPLISVIVRSMGRPELADTLASIAAQDYPNIEVVVVDATGGSHPPLPDIAWPPGHAVRMVGGHRRLPRPMACNTGLEAANGTWFAFLDDDDTYRPGHLSKLARALEGHPEAVVAYARAERIDADGKVLDFIGSPFIRAMYYHGVLFLWQTALIATRVRDQGCRFDEALDICEDLDFMMQVSDHGEFIYIPEVIFGFRQDTGTSGTGRGQNWDGGRTLYFRALLQAKWAGIAERYRAEQMARLGQCLIPYYRGDIARATVLIEAVRQEHPDDTYVIATLARMRLDVGAVDEALDLARRAVEDNPNEPEFRAIIIMALDRAGELDELRRHARFLLAYPNYAQFARQTLERVSDGADIGPGKRDDADAQDAAEPPRFPDGAADPAPIIGQAVALFRYGAGLSAKQLLDEVDAKLVRTPAAAIASASIATALVDHAMAFAFLDQALRLAQHKATLQRVYECTERIFLTRTLTSLATQADAILARLRAARGTGGHAPLETMHIVGDLRPRDGVESSAMRLCRLLSERRTIIPWALVAPEATGDSGDAGRIQSEARVIDLATGSIPAGGGVAIIGALQFASTWVPGLERVERIVIVIDNLDVAEMKAWVALLVHIGGLDPIPEVRVVYASRYLRDRIGVEGGVLALAAMLPVLPRQDKEQPSANGLVLGRLCVDGNEALHPQEAELARRLVAAGYGYRMMDGTPVARCHQGSAWPAGMTLYAPGAMPAGTFLQGLDVYIHWAHPGQPLQRDDDIVLAMAASLPVIQVGADNNLAEWVEHGVTGYVVDGEDEALRHAQELAADHEARLAMGRAARAKVMALRDTLLADLEKTFIL
jgi:tetratricopeptide (TPR) repeat protein